MCYKNFCTFYFKILLVVAFFTLPVVAYTQTAGQEKVLHTAEIYFDFGKHFLRPESDSVLQEIAGICRQHENVQIRVTAHTDSIGNLENNQALSMRRGNSVKSFLINNGVPDANIFIAVFGETRPATSNQTDEGRQRNRRATVEIIQSTPMIRLEGTVLNANTGAGLAATVIIRTKEWQDTLTTDTAGYFSTVVPDGLVLGVDAYAECYFFKTAMLKTAPDMAPLEMPLVPAIAGNALDLDNLYFYGNQPVLLPKSEPELPKILKFMQLNDRMKIEIAGHVNVPNRPKVDRDSREFRLSKARARTVYEYLIDGGIAPDRITYKGYGNWEMRFPNAISEKQQALNRRVEMRVVEAGCEF